MTFLWAKWGHERELGWSLLEQALQGREAPEAWGCRVYRWGRSWGEGEARGQLKITTDLQRLHRCAPSKELAWSSIRQPRTSTLNQSVRSCLPSLSRYSPVNLRVVWGDTVTSLSVLPAGFQIEAGPSSGRTVCSPLLKCSSSLLRGRLSRRQSRTLSHSFSWKFTNWAWTGNKPGNLVLQACQCSKLHKTVIYQS